jgi:hypothetical protein
MKHCAAFLIIPMLAAVRAEAGPDCGQQLVEARAQQVAVAEWQAARRVTGKARLHFHSAPEPACKLRDAFVIGGDRVQALNEYATYTEVQYVHPRTGRVTQGWVDSGRLEEIIAVR